MKKYLLCCCGLAFYILSSGQNAGANLIKAYSLFEKDPQLAHATASLYVVDAVSGKVVFDKNSRLGLAPASTQKVITSVTAMDMLGRDFRYETSFYYDGTIQQNRLNGNIYIAGSHDPTLGTWRYASSTAASIGSRLLTQLRQAGIRQHNGGVVAVTGQTEEGKVPDGWIWQDIGNYYGAAPAAINWNENQFDLYMQPGLKQGDAVAILRTEPAINNNIINELSSGSKGSGDNAYLYFVPGSASMYVKGTVPCCVPNFKISGAVPDGNQFALDHFTSLLQEAGLGSYDKPSSRHVQQALPPEKKLLYTHQSVTLDSIIYWFNKKSINLYGEALIKTMAAKNEKNTSTREGLALLKAFWEERGLASAELNMYDGSGLSPQNRVTTHAQVMVLQYARKQNWYAYFLDALPEYNGMKMKSGTINNVKGFCGYHRARDGKEYIFSFLVNNYSGSASSMVSKMYRVLDVLK